MTERELHEAVGRLSPRQKECLRLVFVRRTSKEIATELGLGPGTVDTYIAEAVATLDAKGRRHASEMLASVENDGANPPPRKLEFENTGVQAGGSGLTPGGHGSRGADWRRWLPIRPAGAAQNDLPVLARLAWIPVIAVFLAIGFGMLAVGLHVLSDLFARSRG